MFKYLHAVVLECLCFLAVGAQAQAQFAPLPPILRNEFPANVYFKPHPPINIELMQITSKGWRPLTQNLQPFVSSLSPQAARCWQQLSSGAPACLSENQLRGLLEFPADKTDLLYLAEEWSKHLGLSVASDLLTVALSKYDSSQGQLERRFELVHQDGEAFPDSIWSLDSKKKSKITFFLDYGFSNNIETSPDAAMLFAIGGELQRQGFGVQFLQTNPNDPASVSAVKIRQQLESQLPVTEKAVIVTLSKGGQEVMDFFLHEFSKLPSLQQKKIRQVISFSGVLRESFLARWLGGPLRWADGPTRAIIKLLMKSFGWGDATYFKALGELGQDAWQGVSSIAEQVQGITWISFVSLPENADGIGRYYSTEKLLPLALAANAGVGPEDGVVESAAQILPPGSGFTQVIVRLKGSHFYPLNKTIAGIPLSADPDAGSIAGSKRMGVHFIDQILQAFPALE